MRIESSVTSVSWIPSEAVEGVPKVPFQLGVGHYDDPLPEHIDDLERLRQDDAFRFANELHAFIDVEDGHITNFGHLGQGHIGSTTLRFGPGRVVFQATSFPEIRPACLQTDTTVTFVQTAGGRPGMPLPRKVSRKPYVQLTGPTVWSTLALTIDADGSSHHELRGASPFPRHWIYDDHRDLVAKSGTIDFPRWYDDSFGAHTPWGTEDSPAFMVVAETALERQVSSALMRNGGRPRVLRMHKGETIVTQGERGAELYLLLDGILSVEVDGEVVAEVGPGAVLGERAVLEEGSRTATLRAVTPAKVAVASPDTLDKDALARISTNHRREAAVPRETAGRTARAR